jgi:hypothetical protein
MNTYPTRDTLFIQGNGRFQNAVEKNSGRSAQGDAGRCGVPAAQRAAGSASADEANSEFRSRAAELAERARKAYAERDAQSGPRVIWKYAFDQHPGNHGIPMPAGAGLLTAQIQDDVFCLWVLVNPTAPPAFRDLALRFTGHSFDSVDAGKYVATFQDQRTGLVYHLFDLGETQIP